VVMGSAAIAIILTSNHASNRGVWAVCGGLLGFSFIGTGLYAWWRRPENRTGALMTFVGFLWFFTVIWNLISIPALTALTPKLVKQAPLITFAYFFPVIGAALVVWALYLTFRRAKYGVSICHVDRVPIVPGRTFHGEIETRVRATPLNGFVVRLTAARRTSRGRNTHEDVLWREEQTVALATPSYEGVRVPFSFDIPADTPGMNDVNEDGAVLWRLDVSAEVPGVDYAAAFDMPVFRTEEKVEQSHALWPAPHADERLWVPDPKSNIAIEPLPNGGEGFRIGSPGGGAFGFAVFLFIWWGVVGMMAIFDVPIFLPIIFGFAGVIILLVAIDWWIGRSLIEASRRTLVYKRAWLGFGPERTIASGEVDDVTTTIGTTVGEGSATTLYYDLIAHQGERKRRIARYLRSKRDAEMLAARIRRDLGIATPA